MFFLNIKKCHPLSYLDERYFLERLYSLKNILDFKFLNSIDLAYLNLFWCDQMTEETYILGCFSQLHPYNIYLSSAYKNVKEQLFPTFIHELIHYKQFHELGFFTYTFLNIPGINKLYLEKEANYFEELSQQ